MQAFLSKINWTQIVAFGAMLITMFGFELSVEDQLKIVAGIQGVQSAITVVLRTFFTKPAPTA